MTNTTCPYAPDCTGACSTCTAPDDEIRDDGEVK